jgi:hypothetical protein
MHLPQRLGRLLLAGAATVLTATGAQAQFSQGFLQQPPNTVHQSEDGLIHAADTFGVRTFTSWTEYVHSDWFQRNNKRCPGALTGEGGELAFASISDCTSSNTNIDVTYDPQGGELYRIPVVVHIIQSPQGQGQISDALVYSQIDVLNEDFRALPGSLGSPGTDTRIEFYLANVDPDGNPTTGINRYTNKKWYNDQGNYSASIGWDSSRYLNIYTNSAGGNLGYAYVPNGGGVVGSSFDGVRILWAAFGLNAPIGPPYNLGRTATHEVGHYLGLYHTFQGGCASASGCYSNGDLICDTNPEGSPNGSGSCARSSCGSPDPTTNYMDYSDDICMDRFTSEQTNRMRCTLDNWRVDLGGAPANLSPSVSISSPSSGASISSGDSVTLSGSATDPEDGNLSGLISWSSNLDGNLGSGANVAANLSDGIHTLTAAVTDSAGATSTDSVNVTVGGSTGGGLTLTGTIYKVKGRIAVDLSWSGANSGSVEVYRNGSLLTTTNNDGAYTDSTGQTGSATYTYQVCEPGGACSNSITLSI